MRKPTRTDRAEFALGRALEAAVSRLPEAAADRAGAALGSLAYAPLGIRRETVEQNLGRAFPDESPAWRADVARGAYRHLGREAAAILRLSRMDAAAIVRRTEMHGWDALQQALGEGRGAILFSGHFGNWEISAASVAARGVPIEAVAKRLRNRLVDARLQQIRAGLGIRTIDQREAPRRVIAALRAGRVVGMVADQDARRAGVFVPFFGHPASAARGPATFALRLGTPLFLGFARRLPGAAPRYEATLERIDYTATDDAEADIHRLTAQLNSRLEAKVRSVPEQYFWFHKRWKTQPPTGT